MLGFEELSPDAPAVILLCSSIGRGSRCRDDTSPRAPRHGRSSVERLRRQSFPGPRDLLGLTAEEIDRSLGVGGDEAARYARLLSRAGQLAFELDRLRSRGIWVVTIADEAYPTRLTREVGERRAARPVRERRSVEAGCGEASRSWVRGTPTTAAVEFTERLAGAAARGGTPVVSGGARGIDVTAMRAAAAADGFVVGVLSEGVERRLRESDTRIAVASGQVVLVSPYHPAAGFSAGAAMGRNKIIYALSDVAVVVSSAAGSGGTWTGAIEAIDGGWVPVLIRDGAGVPDGNRALIAKGGIPFPLEALAADGLTVGELLALAPVGERSVAEASAPYEQQALFEE